MHHWNYILRALALVGAFLLVWQGSDIPGEMWAVVSAAFALTLPRPGDVPADELAAAMSIHPVTPR